MPDSPAVGIVHKGDRPLTTIDATVKLTSLDQDEAN